MNIVVDNDILYKGACYLILDSLVNEARANVGVLGAAKYVVPKKVSRAPLKGSLPDATALIGAFLSEAESIEPSTDEQELAAVLELHSQREGLPFDVGESQLCAVLVCRGVPQLLTGDKRAIAAMEQLLVHEPRLAPARGRVRCLEQLVRLLVGRVGIHSVRGYICAEPNVDKGLALCFSCGSGTPAAETGEEGLESYIKALRGAAPSILSSAP